MGENAEPEEPAKVWRRADWQERFDEEAPAPPEEEVNRAKLKKGPPIRLAASHDDPDELHHEALEWFDPRMAYKRFVRSYFLQYVAPLNPLVFTYYSRYMDLEDALPVGVSAVPDEQQARLAADYEWSVGYAREIRAACVRIMRAGFEGRPASPDDVRLITGAGTRSVPVSPPANVPAVDE